MKTLRMAWLYIAILSFGVYFISCGEEPTPAPTPAAPRVMVTTPSGEQVSKPMAEKPIPDKPVVKPPRPQPQPPRWQLFGDQVVIKDGGSGYSDKYTIVMSILKDNRNDQEYLVFTNRGYGESFLCVVPVVKGK